MKKIFIQTIFFIIFAIISTSNIYADQAQLNKKIYIIDVTSENPNQKINFMMSYIRATHGGEMAH